MLGGAVGQPVPQALHRGCVLLQLGAVHSSLHSLADALVLAADGAARLLRQLAQAVRCDLRSRGLCWCCVGSHIQHMQSQRKKHRERIHSQV